MLFVYLSPSSCTLQNVNFKRKRVLSVIFHHYILSAYNCAWYIVDTKLNKPYYSFSLLSTCIYYCWLLKTAYYYPVVYCNSHLFNKYLLNEVIIIGNIIWMLTIADNLNTIYALLHLIHKTTHDRYYQESNVTDTNFELPMRHPGGKVKWAPGLWVWNQGRGPGCGNKFGSYKNIRWHLKSWH